MYDFTQAPVYVCCYFAVNLYACRYFCSPMWTGPYSEIPLGKQCLGNNFWKWRFIGVHERLKSRAIDKIYIATMNTHQAIN